MKNNIEISLASSYPYQQEFICFLRMKGLSSSTIKTYNSCINIFMGYIKEYELPLKTDYIELEHIERFRRHLLLKIKIGRGTFNKYSYSIRSYYSFLNAEDIQRNEYKNKLNGLKLGKRIPKIVEEIDFKLILDSIKSKKHKAMMYLLISSGIRRNELCGLRSDCIDWEKRMIKIIGKGDKERYSCFSERAKVYMLDYKANSKWKNKDSPYFFTIGSKCNPHTPNSISIIFRLYKDKAGIVKRITLHSLRHSFAVFCLENGLDLESVRQLLGHSKLATTSVYTSGTRLDKIKDNYDTAMNKIEKNLEEV